MVMFSLNAGILEILERILREAAFLTVLESTLANQDGKM
jgi:hypothetical protein